MKKTGNHTKKNTEQTGEKILNVNQEISLDADDKTAKMKSGIKMQASNIDEEGNVLFLDEERLARKVVGFPKFKNHPNGLGIYNFIKTHVLYMRKSR